MAILLKKTPTAAARNESNSGLITSIEEEDGDSVELNIFRVYNFVSA